MKCGNLPDEEDGEKSDCGPLDYAASRSPAKQWSHRAGEGADEGCHGGIALQGRVHRDVEDGREQGQQAGDRVGEDGEHEGAADNGKHADDDAMSKTDASSGQWTVRSANHLRIRFALHHLIQRAGAGGYQCDASQRFQQAHVQGGDARAK